jgi:hydrogenase maturation factor HypF (carbamoyltransferase family)
LQDFNVMHDPVANMKVRVRCSECRTTFRERVQRVVHGERVVCPCCKNEMHFHGIDHHHTHEDAEHFIRHVEARTCRPHF